MSAVQLRAPSSVDSNRHQMSLGRARPTNDQLDQVVPRCERREADVADEGGSVAGRRHGQRDVHGERLTAPIEEPTDIAVGRPGYAQGPLEVQTLCSTEEVSG